MKLPKQPDGTRYMGSTDYSTRITITQPNTGNAADGTPLPKELVASVWANVVQWRAKQADKTQTQQGQSSYKIVIRYPKTFSIDSGMEIQVGQQRHNIDSFTDPDDNRVQMEIWTWVGNDEAVSYGG